MNFQRQYRLVTLDLDGTMFQANSVLFLKEKGLLGDEVELLHACYESAEITESELNRLQAPILKSTGLSRMLQTLLSGPLLRNITEGVELLKRAGFAVSMLTFNPLQIFFKIEYGIDTSISMNAEIEGDSISQTGELPENKLEYLKTYCESKSISLKQVIHVGDGPNDIPTFKVVGLAIALNPTSEIVRKEADLSLMTDDFSLVAREIMKNTFDQT